ncbi:MAG: hypothetical protein H7145_24505 [Akkermansiaceae bacterium]|nr:hypothetical protein [Armatimonadota bacterium]
MAKPTFPRQLSLFLCALILFVTPVTGCNSGTSFSASLLPYAERTRLADDSIGRAIASFNEGDQGKGDAHLHRAVILLTTSLSDDFNDEGFIQVAQRIASLGRPNDAIRLLEPLTKDERVAGDPRLWAALADAANKAANTSRATEAERRAKMEADKIVASFGIAAPDSAKAPKQAALATYAGQYFSEFAEKDYPKALQAYREAHRLMPKDPVIKNNLGYMLADHGASPADFDEAVRLTRSVVEKDPEHPVFLDSFGWALYKRGSETERDLEGARRRLREAADLAPNIPECRYHLAVVYEELDLLPDALREAERAVLLRPGYTEAKELVERLKPLVTAQPSPSPVPDDAPSPVPGVTVSTTPSPTATPAPTDR